MGMTRDDLMYELRLSGYPVSHGTVVNWLRGNTVKGPTMDGLQALVAVFASLRSDSWTKGAYPTVLDAPDDLGRILSPELATAV